MTGTERRWLDYAWNVVNCPLHHRRGCLIRGAASGNGVDGGNELRFPGYIGRSYEPGRGVLLVGHVHREPEPHMSLPGDPARFVAAHFRWIEHGRSDEADAAFLAEVRRYYGEAVAGWNPWRQFFRRIVEDELGMSLDQVAYANLAKCRQDPNRGTAENLVSYCQGQFPAAQLVDAVRPAGVFVCVIAADPRRGVVSWRSPSWDPVVYAFEGRNGRDSLKRRRDEWLPEAAARVKTIQAEVT